MEKAEDTSVPRSEEVELDSEELDAISGGGNSFNTNQTPSISVGENKSMSVGTSTSRQTFSDTLSTKVVQSSGHS